MIYSLNKDGVVFVWHAAVAIAVRLLLVLLGAGEGLVWQPEVSTPANTILKTREGLRLLQLGISPYQGSSCHIPPLWLALTAPVAHHPVLYVLPNIICDVVAATALHASADALFCRRSGSSARDAPWLSASQLALLYLFNPFSMLSCAAGTLTSAENAAVMVAVAGGCLGNGPVVGFGLALGTYLGLHPLLLLVALLLMLYQRPEDPLQSVPQGYSSAQLQQANSSSGGGGSSSAAAVALPSKDAAVATPGTTGLQLRRTQGKQGLQQQQQDLHTAADQQQGEHAVAVGDSQQQRLIRCLWCLCSFIVCSVVLLVLSDQVLQQHPKSQCLLGHESSSSSGVGGRPGPHWAKCWAGRVYGLTLFFQDLTPNIGLWWYFFTEVFTEFQAFFLFVFHSFALALVVPMAIRFPNRPLFVVWLQLFVNCMFKPYACVGDMVPWMALLPLLQQQLQCLKLRMFLINSFVLLMVLGPAMWHQWINLDSANANFFYSITLLLGVWYTVFLMQMLRLTVMLDRWLRGKGPAPVLVSADGRAVSGAAAVGIAAG